MSPVSFSGVDFFFDAKHNVQGSAEYSNGLEKGISTAAHELVGLLAVQYR